MNDDDKKQPTRVGDMLKFYMAVKEIGVRDLARDIGVSAATISRVTRGEDVDLNTYFKLNQWLWRG